MSAWFRKVRRLVGAARRVERRLERMQEALGRIESRQIAAPPPGQLRAAEFRVFSQWGEDGIIQHLINTVPIEHRNFVEFGVEDYSEANTRFLLMHDNWSGLLLDGDPDNIARIRRDDLSWRYTLKAECAFITRENINELLSRNGMAGDVGLLSIDIDGNDYWVWEALDVINPRIVVIEYNSRFGPSRAVSVPYDAGFTRAKAHHSTIYYGASLAALVRLGERKGYDFVGSNSTGCNAFFVRRELRPACLPRRTAQEEFVAGQFREARGANGELIFLGPEEEQRVLDGLPVVEVSP